MITISIPDAHGHILSEGDIVLCHFENPMIVMLGMIKVVSDTVGIVDANGKMMERVSMSVIKKIEYIGRYEDNRRIARELGLIDFWTEKDREAGLRKIREYFNVIAA